MSQLFTNPFGSRPPAQAEDEPNEHHNADRRMSTASLEEPSSNHMFAWHETFLFGPAAADQPRRRRASSLGEISAPVAAETADDNGVEDAEPRMYSRLRTPSVVDARLGGHGRTRQRQGSTASDRRTSVYDRRGSAAGIRRPSIAQVQGSRTRQPSVAWARQSSLVDQQLATMTWSRAENIYGLDPEFYNDADAQRQFFQKPLIANLTKEVKSDTDGSVSDSEKGRLEKDAHDYPTISEPTDPARILGRLNLRTQKLVFMSFILSLNMACLMAALFGGKHSGTFVIAFILYVKSKDFLSVLLAMVTVPSMAVWHWYRPLPPVKPQWILTLIPAYSESEDQIVRTIISLRDNKVEPHEQVMVVILDGKPRDVKAHMRIIKSFRRPYVTSRWKRGELLIDAGFVEDVPVIVFEKIKNAGKKDSLIFCHDLFNVMRDNAPLYTKLLRQEIWTKLLPLLTANQSIPFQKFDMVFCTDADSTIHPGALAGLANALARDPDAIASCGLVLVELEPGRERSLWNLYQSFQYTFGQYVRRRAEGAWGKVTCLPGCITMIAVRPEMAGAMKKYAQPITKSPVIHHQVQYLGTDRRLTYTMLSQDKKLHTLFVPSAVSETVAPQSLEHYLSQRRRWGANAYFNNYFYCFGENMIIITRIAASVELVRLSLVYYRIANTCLFIYGVTKEFHIMKLVPLLIVSQLPTAWYFCNMLFEPELRKRAPKLLAGYAINKFVSPVLALMIFSKVLKNLGSQVWGLTGGSNAQPVVEVAAVAEVLDEKIQVLTGKLPVHQTEKVEWVTTTVLASAEKDVVAKPPVVTFSAINFSAQGESTETPQTIGTTPHERRGSGLAPWQQGRGLDIPPWQQRRGSEGSPLQGRRNSASSVEFGAGSAGGSNQRRDFGRPSLQSLQTSALPSLHQKSDWASPLQRDRRGSASPAKERQGLASPVKETPDLGSPTKARRGSASPNKIRYGSGSPVKDRQGSTSPLKERQGSASPLQNRLGSASPMKQRRDSAPSIAERRGSGSPITRDQIPSLRPRQDSATPWQTKRDVFMPMLQEEAESE